MNFCNMYNKAHKHINMAFRKEYKPVREVNIVIGLIILVFLVPLYIAEEIINHVRKITNPLIKFMYTDREFNFLSLWGGFILAVTSWWFVILTIEMSNNMNQYTVIIITIMLLIIYFCVMFSILTFIAFFSNKKANKFGHLVFEKPFNYLYNSMISRCEIKKHDWLCDRCGTTNPESHEFCRNCKEGWRGKLNAE